MKICSKCKEAKPEAEYRQDPRQKDGLRSQCKSCQRVTSTESWRTRRANGTLKTRGPQRGAGRSGNKPAPPPPEPTEARCPACNGTKLTPLAADETRQRFQCANDDCGEHFSLPIAVARTVTGAESPLETVAPANILDCPKCLKPYKRGGARRQKHVDNCDGTPLPPREDKPEKPALRLVDHKSDRGPSLKSRVISFIRSERDYHTGQGDVGRRMIDAIADVKEDGE